MEEDGGRGLKYKNKIDFLEEKQQTTYLTTTMPKSNIRLPCYSPLSEERVRDLLTAVSLLSEERIASDLNITFEFDKDLRKCALWYDSDSKVCVQACYKALRKQPVSKINKFAISFFVDQFDLLEHYDDSLYNIDRPCYSPLSEERVRDLLTAVSLLSEERIASDLNITFEFDKDLRKCALWYDSDSKVCVQACYKALRKQPVSKINKFAISFFVQGYHELVVDYYDRLYC